MSDAHGWRHRLSLMLRGDPRGHSDASRQEIVAPILYVTVAVLVAFAIVNHANGRVALAMLELAIAASLIVLLAARRRGGWAKASYHSLLFLGVVLFTALLLDGGVGGMGPYWSLAYPFLAFALVGVRSGWWWIVLLAVSEGAVLAMGATGILSLPHPPEVRFIFPVMFGVFTLVANLLAVHAECQRGELVQAHELLKQEREQLDRRVHERTRTLRRVNRRLKAEVEERKQAMEALAESERQLRQAQKMDAMGTLAGGIAHDFNNMLAGVLAHLYMLDGRLEHDPEARERLRKMRKLLDHGADMVRQLMTFARQDDVSFKTFDFIPFIKEAWKLAKVSVPAHIQASFDFPSGTVPVHGDATQLQQVLMNLMNNARDALAGVESPEMRVVVEVRNADDALRARHPEAGAERYLCLSVRDNGSGMDEGVLDRIFDPFFTTKEAGKGTGLGLAMVFGAVKAHGGFIEVDSKPGAGTEFRVFLPVADGVQATADDETLGHAERGCETVLLADDDEGLLEANREVLTSLGYRVLTARDGVEAVERFREHAGGVDMVILDVVMPRLRGPKAAERIRRIRPVPILYVTGYDKDGSLAGDVPVDRHQVLEKPFTMQELSRRIRMMLDEERTFGGSTIPPAT